MQVRTLPRPAIMSRAPLWESGKDTLFVASRSQEILRVLQELVPEFSAQVKQMESTSFGN